MSTSVYDGAISLGFNCATAMQIEMRGMRYFSSPFDWISVDEKMWEKGLDTWRTIIKHQFKIYLDQTQLQLQYQTPLESRDHLGDHKVCDASTGILFPHDFRVWPVEDEAFAAVQKRYLKRAERLHQSLSQPGTRWLFVMNADAPVCSVAYIRALLALLREQYPNTQIDLFVILFRAEKDVACEEIEEGLYLLRRKRKLRSKSDFRHRDRDWNWLDAAKMRRDRKDELKQRKVRIEAQDQCLLREVDRWRQVDDVTYALYLKNFRLLYGRGFARFYGKSFLKCKLPFWLWRVFGWRCALNWVSNED